MIKHVVMWRIADDQPQSKAELIKTLIDKLEALPPIIPQIKEFVVGANEKEAPAAFDVTLVSSFDSWEALSEYQVHPTHQEVGAFLKGAATDRAVVDFEF